MFGSRVNHSCIHSVLTPWSISGLPTSHRPFSLVWSGDNSFVWGASKPPPLVEKLLSEDGIKVTGELGVSLSGQAFMASQGVSRKSLDEWEAIS